MATSPVTSVSPITPSNGARRDSLARSSSAIRTSTSAEMTKLANRVLAARSAAEAEAIVYETMHARFPEHLEHGAGALVASETDGGDDE